MELKSLYLAVVLLVVLITVQESVSKPTIDGWAQYHNRFGIHDPQRRAASEQCDSSSQVRELCQRCAKVTKSRLAYPMCCESREDAREWCRQLLIVG